MKICFLLLLLLFSACRSKNEDPVSKAANPDAVPAGQHLIKVVYSGSGWLNSPYLYIYQSTANTAGKKVYSEVSGSWHDNPDATNSHVLRLAYRDTAFALHFVAGVQPSLCVAPSPPPGNMAYVVYVDGREQDSQVVRPPACPGQETDINTKNLK